MEIRKRNTKCYGSSETKLQNGKSKTFYEVDNIRLLRAEIVWKNIPKKHMETEPYLSVSKKASQYSEK